MIYQAELEKYENLRDAMLGVYFVEQCKRNDPEEFNNMLNNAMQDEEFKKGLSALIDASLSNEMIVLLKEISHAHWDAQS